MMKATPLLFACLFSGGLYASTITLTPTAAQDQAIEEIRTRFNNYECVRIGLAAGCTFAQAQGADANTVYAPTPTALIRGILLRRLKEAKARQTFELQGIQTFMQGWEKATPDQRAQVCALLNVPTTACHPLKW